MSARERSEPELGSLDDFEDQDLDSVEHRRAGPARGQGSGAARRRRSQRSRGWLLVLVLVLAAGALAVANRDRLHWHLPVSETRELLNAGARAETEQRWYGSDDGNDAQAIYQRVLAEDPDNDAARLGLRRVGERLEADAGAAIDAGELERAETLIDQLAGVGVPGERTAALRQRVEQAGAAGQDLRELLAHGRAALAERRIRGRDGALAAFTQMLVRDPGNAVAARGIDDALQILVEEAQAAIAKGDARRAEELATAVAAQQPLHPALPRLRQALGEARLAAERVRAESVAETERLAAATAAETERLAAEVDAESARVAAQADAESARLAAAAAAQSERRAAEMAAAERAAADRAAAAERVAAERRARQAASALAGADDALRDGRLEEALTGYRRALSLAPDSAEAADGLALTGQALLDQAEDALADSNPTVAAAVLALAERAEADPARLARLQGRLGDLNDRLASVLARPELDAGQQAELDRLLVRARAAEERGDLVEPAGDSAYDLYRQALRLDPMDDQARRAVTALPRRAQDRVARLIELGQPYQAGRALDALTAMAPMDSSLPELRRQLADAWLQQGVRDAGAGAFGQAQVALEQARRLAPGHPGINALARQLDGG